MRWSVKIFFSKSNSKLTSKTAHKLVYEYTRLYTCINSSGIFSWNHSHSEHNPITTFGCQTLAVHLGSGGSFKQGTIPHSCAFFFFNLSDISPRSSHPSIQRGVRPLTGDLPTTVPSPLTFEFWKLFPTLLCCLSISLTLDNYKLRLY